MDCNTAILEFDAMKKFRVSVNVKKPAEKDYVGPFGVALITKPRKGAKLEITYFIGIPCQKGAIPALTNDYLRQILLKPAFVNKFGDRKHLIVILFRCI